MNNDENAKMSKADIAYEYIKEMIITAKISPLTDISDTLLQQTLGISRTPIRNAIRRLEREHLVSVYPQKGTFVNPITWEDIHQVYEVRALVEPFLAKSYCENLTDADEELLMQLRKQFIEPPQELSTTENRDYFINLDKKLHANILSVNKNKFFQDLMQNVRDYDDRMRILTSRRNKAYSVNIQEHIDIIDAILSKSPAQAERIMQKHIQTSRESTIRYALGLGLANGTGL